jgi:hypothetical protein
MAVENRTAVDVVPERTVLSLVAPERAVETTRPAEVADDKAVDVAVPREVWVESAVLEEVDSAVFNDRLFETCVVCDVWADRRLEVVLDTDASEVTTVEMPLVLVRPAGSAP